MENNFVKSLTELENIIKKLESEDVSLDESIALFEKGVVLSNECRKTLEKAENKIITLTDAEGENLDD